MYFSTCTSERLINMHCLVAFRNISTLSVVKHSVSRTNPAFFHFLLNKPKQFHLALKFYYLARKTTTLFFMILSYLSSPHSLFEIFINSIRQITCICSAFSNFQKILLEAPVQKEVERVVTSTFYSFSFFFFKGIWKFWAV